MAFMTRKTFEIKKTFMILEDLCSVLSFPFHVCQQDCPGRRSQVAYQGKVRLLSLIEVFCLLAVHLKSCEVLLSFRSPSSMLQLNFYNYHQVMHEVGEAEIL